MISAIKIDSGVEMGAFSFPDRKRPYIAIKSGGGIMCYGQFYDEEHATDFMDALCKNLGIKNECREDGSASATPKHGTWIKFGDTGSEYTDRWQCDQCLRTVRSERWGKTCEYELCPHCGAVMRGGADNAADRC